MSVGLPPDKPQLDYWSGTLTRDLMVWLERVDRLQAFLAATPDATLQAAPYGYTTGEVPILKSGIGDLKQLADLCRNTGTLPSSKNFLQFAQLLAGLGQF